MTDVRVAPSDWLGFWAIIETTRNSETPACREISSAPRTEINRDRTASAVMNDESIRCVRAEVNERIRTFEAIGMLFAFFTQLFRHSLAAVLHHSNQ